MGECLFHVRSDTVHEFSEAKNAVRAAGVVDCSSIKTILQSPGKLAMQGRTPAQGPKVELAKTSCAGNAHALVSKLRSSKKPVGGNL